MKNHHTTTVEKTVAANPAFLPPIIELKKTAGFGYPLPSTYSFPSGHAFVSFCFFLCLAEILIRDEWPVAGKVAMWSAALACTLTIGLSRVYLGVHYPTDVLAGYAAGIVWTTLIRVTHHARQRWAGRHGGG